MTRLCWTHYHLPHCLACLPLVPASTHLIIKTPLDLPPHHLRLRFTFNLLLLTPYLFTPHTRLIISASIVMPPATSSPTTASPEPTSPAAPASTALTSPPTASPTRVDDIALKTTDAGVKKKKQSKRQTAKKASLNMQRMHAFCTSEPPLYTRLNAIAITVYD